MLEIPLPVEGSGISTILRPTCNYTSFFHGITCCVLPYLPPVPRADAQVLPSPPYCGVTSFHLVRGYCNITSPR